MAELEARLADVEALLAPVSLAHDGTTVRFSGVNVQIVSGSGSTEATPTNGLGNLIVGYNEMCADELPEDCLDELADGHGAPSCDYPLGGCKGDDDRGLCGVGRISRWGSHNIIVGSDNNYEGYGGLVMGSGNFISGEYNAVLSGVCNVAEGNFATITGGEENHAKGDFATVSGGRRNWAWGWHSTVIGGKGNAALGDVSISGGFWNRATGRYSLALGGFANEALGEASSVTGGHNRTAPGEYDWVAGSLFEDE